MPVWNPKNSQELVSSHWYLHHFWNLTKAGTPVENWPVAKIKQYHSHYVELLAKNWAKKHPNKLYHHDSLLTGTPKKAKTVGKQVANKSSPYSMGVDLDFGARPESIGSLWEGEDFIHGPRLVNPKKCEEFRLGKPSEKGQRQVFCRLKGKKEWVRQSTLTPKKSYGNWAGIIGEHQRRAPLLKKRKELMQKQQLTLNEAKELDLLNKRINV